MMSRVIALVVGVGMLAGCVPGVGIKEAVNDYQAAADQVQLGDPEDKVLALLEPSQAHLLPKNKRRPEKLLLNGKRIDIHFFRSAWHSDGLNTDDEFTPYIFVNGYLAAVGWAALGGPATHAQPTTYFPIPRPRFLPPTYRAPSLMDQGMVRQQVQQELMHRQILNHGAGGCTPNFATGGCL